MDEITDGEGAYAGIDPVAKESTGMVSASVVDLCVCLVPLLQIERWTIPKCGEGACMGIDPVAKDSTSLVGLLRWTSFAKSNETLGTLNEFIAHT